MDEQEDLSVCGCFISEHDTVPLFPKILVSEGNEGPENLFWEVVWALNIGYALVRRQGHS